MIELICPENNKTISTLKNNVLSYIDKMAEQAKKVENDYIFNGLNWGLNKVVDIDDFVGRRNFVLPIIFEFKTKGKVTLIC